MKYKDWLKYEFPVEEIIVNASIPGGSDAPVRHPIGVAGNPYRDFDEKLLYEFQDVNINLCYSNIRKGCGKRTNFRKKVIRITNKDFVTIEGKTLHNNKAISFNDYFISLMEHKFCISPEGNGIDCHRHYETILAKGIPIVNKPNEKYSNERWGTNSYMEKYDNLPVLWTSNYKELSVEYLNDKYDEFMETEFDFSRLTKSYWDKHSNNLEECITYWTEKFK